MGRLWLFNLSCDLCFQNYEEWNICKWSLYLTYCQFDNLWTLIFQIFDWRFSYVASMGWFCFTLVGHRYFSQTINWSIMMSLFTVSIHHKLPYFTVLTFQTFRVFGFEFLHFLLNFNICVLSHLIMSDYYPLLKVNDLIGIRLFTSMIYGISSFLFYF